LELRHKPSSTLGAVSLIASAYSMTRRSSGLNGSQSRQCGIASIFSRGMARACRTRYPKSMHRQPILTAGAISARSRIPWSSFVNLATLRSRLPNAWATGKLCPRAR
jgi:hypothetical protein